MKKVFEFICEISQSGKRLDIFLFEKMNDNTSELLSRNRIKSLIENQCVEKDDKVITSPSVKTILNSKYRIHIPPPISAKPEPQNISLDIITHISSSTYQNYRGIRFFPANFSKEEIYRKFMCKSDVLIHPTYVDTFGLVVLEALAHGLGIISTDLYALPEMVYDGVNGIVINPPISIWDGYLPSKYYKNLSNIKETINSIDTFSFEKELEKSILKFSENTIFRTKAKEASKKIFLEKFQ